MKRSFSILLFLALIGSVSVNSLQAQTLRQVKKLLPGVWVWDKEATQQVDWPQDRKDKVKQFITLEKIELEFQKKGKMIIRTFSQEGKWTTLEGTWKLGEETIQYADRKIADQYSTMNNSIARGTLMVVTMKGDNGKDEKGTIFEISKERMLYMDVIAPFVMMKQPK